MSSPGPLRTLSLLQIRGSRAHGGTGVSGEKNSTCKGQTPAEHDDLGEAMAPVPQLPARSSKTPQETPSDSYAGTLLCPFLPRTGLRSATQLRGLPHPTSGSPLPPSPAVCSTNYVSVAQQSSPVPCFFCAIGPAISWA